MSAGSHHGNHATSLLPPAATRGVGSADKVRRTAQQVQMARPRV